MESKAEKRKVLVFIDWFLPGDKAGGPVRSVANLLDHFGSEFDFSVVTRDTDYTSSVPYAGVKSDAWNKLPGGQRVFYVSGNKLSPGTIASILEKETYDVVYLNGMWSKHFTIEPLQVLKRMKKNVRVVVAVRGMLAPSALAIKPLKKKLFLAYAKLRNLFSGVIFHATTEEEAQQARKFFGEKNEIIVAGNLPRRSMSAGAGREKKKGAVRIVNVARIAPEKNTLYAVELLSMVKSRAEADFFGPVYNEEYAGQCREAAARLPENVKLDFRGALDSGKIEETLPAYDLLLLPTRGENFGHIILEAMQCGVPVLISDKTPWKDLEKEKAGWVISLDEKEKFAAVIDRVSEMDETEYREWSEGAKRAAEKYISSSSLPENNRKLFA
ncbi:MAG TPA: glycosyltransferase family 4 protein [Bacteroidia bacterium]|nr:glycosyltransferase family 4 protein [Bacteroidia bacterium]